MTVDSVKAKLYYDIDPVIISQKIRDRGMFGDISAWSFLNFRLSCELN